MQQSDEKIWIAQLRKQTKSIGKFVAFHTTKLREWVINETAEWCVHFEKMEQYCRDFAWQSRKNSEAVPVRELTKTWQKFAAVHTRWKSVEVMLKRKKLLQYKTHEMVKIKPKWDSLGRYIAAIW